MTMRAPRHHEGNVYLSHVLWLDCLIQCVIHHEQLGCNWLIVHFCHHKFFFYWIQLRQAPTALKPWSRYSQKLWWSGGDCPFLMTSPNFHQIYTTLTPNFHQTFTHTWQFLPVFFYSCTFWPNLIDGERIKQHVTISRCRLDEERRLVKNNNIRNALLKLQSEKEISLSSILDSNNLMSNSNNTNCSNDDCTITSSSSSSINNSNNSRKTTITSTINSGNSNCINTQNININVQDMGQFPHADRNRSLQAHQDLYFFQANMYQNALQKNLWACIMDIVDKVNIIILWAGLCITVRWITFSILLWLLLPWVVLSHRMLLSILMILASCTIIFHLGAKVDGVPVQWASTFYNIIYDVSYFTIDEKDINREWTERFNHVKQATMRDWGKQDPPSARRSMCLLKRLMRFVMKSSMLGRI